MKKLKWLIYRLRQMSISEVIFRLRRTVLQTFEKKKVLSGWQPLPRHTVTAKAALFGTSIDIINAWEKSHTLHFDQLELYLKGKIDFFGHSPLDVGIPVKWHTDPVTGIESPLEFGKSLDYRDDKKVGNVKFIWELGRHQHLVPLAAAYAVTGDVKYRDAVISQIDGWIEENPFGMGIHWCSSLEVGLRLISWSLVHSFFAIRDGEKGLFLASETPVKLQNSIHQQAYFIRHFLSLHSSANNHLIGELTGLWTVCQVFDLGADGQCWSDFCYSQIHEQSRRQVFEDGVNKEQAIYYHLWVLEYFIFAWLIGNHSKKYFSQTFSDTIEKMSDFILSVSTNSGCPPQIGDADDGFVSRFEPNWPQQPYNEISAIVNSLFRSHADASTQKVFWYTAIRQDWSAGDFPALSQRHYPQLYQQGGYAMLGDSSCHIVMDAGPLGYLGIAAHGHADALSICLAVNNVWWLVDPGTYAYHSKPEWRSYFRGTSAHNTIKINYHDQSTICGAFMWSQKAEATFSRCEVEGQLQYVSASHDGYKRDGVIHHRDLCFDEEKKQLLITDHIEMVKSCTGTVDVEIFFHFSPEVTLVFDKKMHYWIAKHENSSAQLVFILDNLWTVEIVKGQETPILGWYSPALEEKIPTNVLRGVVTVGKNAVSVSKILIK